MNAPAAPTAPSPDPKEHFKYLRGGWAYLCSPRGYLEARDLDHAGHVLNALKWLGYGALLAVSISWSNLRFMGVQGGEATKKLYEGTVLTHTLFVASFFGIIAIHFLSRLLGGSGGWRRTWTAFAYYYAFVWPATILSVILVGLFIRWTLDIPWIETAPFMSDDPQPVVERTVGNILLVAVAMTTLLWLAGYLIWAFSSALMVAQRLNRGRSFGLAIGYFMLFAILGAPLATLAHGIADVLDPLIAAVSKGQ